MSDGLIAPEPWSPWLDRDEHAAVRNGKRAKPASSPSPASPTYPTDSSGTFPRVVPSNGLMTRK